MAPILSFPFRLHADGSPVTVEQSSDQAHAEQLAILVSTRPGERVLLPEFGVTDPAFTSGIDLAQVAAGVGDYGPPVEIVDLVQEPDPSTPDAYLARLEFR